MEIKTDRTFLREFRPADLEALHAIFSDPLVMEYVEPPYSLAQTEAFLQDFCIARHGALAVERRDGGQVIGYVLFNDRFEPGVYEMGWIFNRAWWRQGYAYEACAALAEYAFSALGAHKLWAETIDPVKSMGLMEKLGMRPEGVQRRHTLDSRGQWTDLYLYGLLREDLFP